MAEEPTYVVRPPTKFGNARELDCIAVSRLPDHGCVRIDLSRVSFLRPAGLVGILVFVEHLLRLRQHSKIELRLPENPRVRDYLFKVDFLSALRWLVSGAPRTGLPPQDVAVLAMIPVRRFRSSAEVEAIANRMAEVFTAELIGLGTLLQPAHTIFAELADNVLHHSGTDGGGVVVAQEYRLAPGRLARSRRVIEIAVGDAGRGIRAALSTKPELAARLSNDRDAILMALEDGVSSLPDETRGYGLGYVAGVVTEAKRRELTLRSGGGWVTVRSGGHTQSGKCEPLPGTIAHAVIFCQ